MFIEDSSEVEYFMRVLSNNIVDVFITGTTRYTHQMISNMIKLTYFTVWKGEGTTRN
jgi:hypothetical protein